MKIMLFSNSISRILLLTALTAASAAVSAKYSVAGKITEAESAEPLPMAVYHIFSANDTIHPIINNVTAADGSFREVLPRTGSYRLTAEYLGMKTATVDFSVNAGNDDALLGEIALSPDSEQLAEVTVLGRKPLVVSDGANLEYNVKEDPTSATSSILELLRKVPMVTVDGEDNIRVNGSQDFRIYLNGKPNPMFDSEPQRVLKAMPASSITRIEVLTEPGAKYDAEGTGGILNIVMDTGGNAQAADGYAGNVSIDAGVDNISASVFGRGKYKNISGSASATYANGKIFKRTAYSQSTTEYLNDDENHLMVYDMTKPDGNAFEYVQASASFNWEPNKSNLFTVTADVNQVTGYENSFGTTRIYNRAGDLRYEMLRNIYGDMTMTNLTVDASYQHLFGSQDNTLTTSLQYSRNDNHLLIDIDENDTKTSNDMNTNNNQYTAQIDWYRRFNDHHTVEAGAKGVITDNRNESFSSIDNTPDNDRVDMKQYRNIAAVYASYKAMYGNFSGTAGLRYEYTHMGVDYYTSNFEDFGSHLNDLVPNVALSYSFSPVTTLRAAYNMRISRPSIRQINPYQYSVALGHVNVGNPDLKSQHSNNFSIAFSSYAGKVGFNIKAEYRLSSNVISQYIYTDGDIIYDSYINGSRQQQASLDASVNWMISPKMMLGASGSIRYTDYSKFENISGNSGWSGNVNANWSYTMPWRMQASAFGGLSTRMPQLQGHSSGWNYYGISISRSFLPEDALKLTLSGMNMFSKWMSWKNYSENAQIVQRSVYRRRPWNVSIGLTWNFGHLKSNFRQLNTKINNDDSVKTENGGGGIL